MPGKGLRIKAIREKHNLNRDVFGSKLGLSYDQVCKIENGHRQPTEEVLLKLKKIFNVSIDYIFTGDLLDSAPKSSVDSSTLYEKLIKKTILDYTHEYDEALQQIQNPELEEYLKAI